MRGGVKSREGGYSCKIIASGDSYVKFCLGAKLGEGYTGNFCYFCNFFIVRIITKEKN